MGDLYGDQKRRSGLDAHLWPAGGTDHGEWGAVVPRGGGAREYGLPAVVGIAGATQLLHDGQVVLLDGLSGTVTYRARSALRDAAKALAFPPDVVDRAAKTLDTPLYAQAAEELPSDPSAPSLPWQILSELLRQMDGVPWHLSIHVGGMLITAAALVDRR